MKNFYDYVCDEEGPKWSGGAQAMQMKGIKRDQRDKKEKGIKEINGIKRKKGHK